MTLPLFLLLLFLALSHPTIQHHNLISPPPLGLAPGTRRDYNLNAPMQVWRLTIRLSSPWPMQKEPITDFPALALVIKESGTWKFERFLTEEELQAFSTDGGQP